MKRKKLVILPRLYDAHGSMEESWFVFYSCRNPKSDKMDRFRVYDGFKPIKKKEARYNHAEKLIEQLKTKLLQGWTPYDDDLVIYDDLIQYSNVARMYGAKRKANLTFEVYLSEFLKDLRVTVSPKTFESYQSKTRLFAQWLIKQKMADNDVSCINEDLILKFFKYLIHDRKLQGLTIEKYGQNLRQLFRWLLNKKIIYSNPMPAIPKVANTVDHSAKPIRGDDVERFKQYIHTYDPQLWLAIQFEFYCFIRPGRELRFMKVQWIDFFNGTISIPSANMVNGESVKISKNGKSETVAIPSQFLNVLIKDYNLDQFDKSFYVFGKNGVPGAQHLGFNTLRNRFNRFRKALNMSTDYKFYSWKHTGGVNASNAGIPVKDIQMQMRHHSLDVTDKYLRKMKGIDSDHLKNRFPSI